MGAHYQGVGGAGGLAFWRSAQTAGRAALWLRRRGHRGPLRALAVAGATRSRVMPNLPTVAESGVPGFEYSGWYGLWAPAKTPAPLLVKINEDYSRVLVGTVVKERFGDAAIETVGGSAETFATHVTGELRRWAKLAADTGIRAE